MPPRFVLPHRQTVKNPLISDRSPVFDALNRYLKYDPDGFTSDTVSDDDALLPFVGYLGTRLILLNGDAGQVIGSFGMFVVGVNFVVGAVIS